MSRGREWLERPKSPWGGGARAPQLERNVIYCGDCLGILKDQTKFPDESVDLVYLDPPFFSRKEYENIWIEDKATRLGFSDREWKKLSSSIDPNIVAEYRAIEERWRGGGNGIHVYIAYMRERVDQCWRILKPTGSIYLHCDHHASHYLKTMMDEVFGYGNFRNEIVWKRTARGFKGSQFRPRSYNTNVDSILFYAKSDRAFFDMGRVMEPYSQGYLDSAFRLKDGRGRYYLDTAHNRAGASPRPNLCYEYRGIFPPHRSGWKVSKERMRELDEAGDIVKKDSRLYRKIRPGGGRIRNTLWDDIGEAKGRERLGYPTQKPEALLDRIISASTEGEGSVVVDPFCGCGTTLKSAKRLGRRWVGIDISRVACDVMVARLGGKARVVGCESPEELAGMEPHDFARLVIVEKMKGTINPKKAGDGGIDGWVDVMSTAVQVKRWRRRVGRPEVDRFKAAVERDRKDRGIIVAMGFSRDAINEAARIREGGGVEIELREVAEVFGWERRGQSPAPGEPGAGPVSGTGGGRPRR